MGNTVLLFESRDLCYESNRYFAQCLQKAFEGIGYPSEICDLSEGMDALEGILKRQDEYLLAIDFNSLLPRLELEDGTPYLEAFHVPFYNYLVDHPLYHHAALKRDLPNHSVICIDICHRNYLQGYYPRIRQVLYVPLGAMKAGLERSFGQKRLELLFLGTYDSDAELYQQLKEYPLEKEREVSALIEMMRADPELTQEGALGRYLEDKGEILDGQAFARRLNGDYLADLYLRNLYRRQAVLAATRANVPMAVIGHGWEQVRELDQGHVSLYKGVGFAASLQMMADARMLLNATPGFHGGLHDRAYSAMINRALCFTEGSRFARQALDGEREAVFYDIRNLHDLTEKIAYMHGHPRLVREMAERAYQKAAARDTWEMRVTGFAAAVIPGYAKHANCILSQSEKSVII